MFHLLDVNVLIAAADPAHAFHADFRAWHTRRRPAALATCPLTENGFLRIYGHPSYEGGPGSPGAALPPLRALRARAGSVFLAASYSLADPQAGIVTAGLTPRQLTDVYLWALAHRNGGIFATFDTRIPLAAYPSGNAALEIIPTGNR